jgi:hypothetical protein
VADSPGEILRRSLNAGQPTVRRSFDGWVSSLALECRQASSGWFSGRLAAAGVLAMLTCLAVIGLMRGILTENLFRWPCAAGTIVGLAWWLWLSPSIVGLGIALVSVFGAGRSRMIAKK